MWKLQNSPAGKSIDFQVSSQGYFNTEVFTKTEGFLANDAKVSPPPQKKKKGSSSNNLFVDGLLLLLMASYCWVKFPQNQIFKDSGKNPNLSIKHKENPPLIQVYYLKSLVCCFKTWWLRGNTRPNETKPVDRLRPWRIKIGLFFLTKRILGKYNICCLRESWLVVNVVGVSFFSTQASSGKGAIDISWKKNTLLCSQSVCLLFSRPQGGWKQQAMCLTIMQPVPLLFMTSQELPLRRCSRSVTGTSQAALCQTRECSPQLAKLVGGFNPFEKY